jgi:hypothetical protein
VALEPVLKADVVQVADVLQAEKVTQHVTHRASQLPCGHCHRAVPCYCLQEHSSTHLTQHLQELLMYLIISTKKLTAITAHVWPQSDWPIDWSNITCYV